MKIKKKFSFTLIELIFVISIMAILGVSIASFISLPIRIYAQTVNRAELVDLADIVIRQMEHDIRTSVPNSIRVKTSGNLSAVEMLHSVGGYRYRINPPGTTSLNTSGPDSEFDVLSPFSNEVLSGGSYRVVINNTGDEVNDDSDQPYAGRNVYGSNVSPGVITPSTSTITLSNPTSTTGHIVINPAFHFRQNSPQRRVYIADTPITYLCNLNSSARNITKFMNYNLQASQPINSAIAPLSTATSALLARNVTACNFSYQAGTAERYGVITVRITVTDLKSNEKISLVQQIRIPNAA